MKEWNVTGLCKWRMPATGPASKIASGSKTSVPQFVSYRMLVLPVEEKDSLMDHIYKNMPDLLEEQNSSRHLADLIHRLHSNIRDGDLLARDLARQLLRMPEQQVTATRLLRRTAAPAAQGSTSAEPQEHSTPRSLTEAPNNHLLVNMCASSVEKDATAHFTGEQVGFKISFDSGKESCRAEVDGIMLSDDQIRVFLEVKKAELNEDSSLYGSLVRQVGSRFVAVVQSRHKEYVVIQEVEAGVFQYVSLLLIVLCLLTSIHRLLCIQLSASLAFAFFGFFKPAWQDFIDSATLASPSTQSQAQTSIKMSMLIMSAHGPWRLNRVEEVREFDLFLRAVIKHKGIVPGFVPKTVETLL